MAENRHYKIANTSFLLLLSSLKIDRKMTQRVGEEIFFFYNLYLNSAEKYLNETPRTFFWSSPEKLGYFHTAPAENSALLPKKIET